MEDFSTRVSQKTGALTIWATVVLLMGLVGSAVGLGFGLYLLNQGSEGFGVPARIEGFFILFMSLFAGAASVLQYHVVTGFSLWLESIAGGVSPAESRRPERPKARFGVTCQQCGSSNPKEHCFCDSCGASLEGGMGA